MSKYSTILIASLAATFGLAAAASFLPEQRLWGVNHLGFYPIWVRAVALAAIALAFVPGINTRVYALFIAGMKKFRTGNRFAPWIVAGLSFGAVALFSSCQSSTLLLGDGQFVSNTIELLYQDGKPGHIESIRQINVNEPIARGTYTFNYLAGALARRVGDQTATEGIRRLNVFLGGCWVLVLGLVLLHAPMSDGLRAWLLVLAGTTGALQLFFGYVENYTILIFLGSVYVVAAFSVLYRDARAWPLIIIVLLCAWTHIEGVLLFPSLILLLVWRHGRTAPRRLRVWALALSAATAFGAIAVAQIPGAKRFFLTLSGDGEYYGIFSVLHLVDLFNAVMILLPSLLMFAVVAVWPAKQNANKKKEPPAAPFVATILAPCTVFLLVFKAEIGVARDWDLFALTVVGLIPAALLLIRRVDAVDAGAVQRAFTPVLTLSLVLTASWIGVNASPERTPKRIEAILTYDESLAPYAYETLAKHYHANNRLTDAIATIEKGAALSKNPRHQIMLSGFYREYGDMDSAERLLRRVVRNHPDNADARRNLCILFYEQQRFEELIEVGVPGVQQYPTDIGFHYMLGRAMLEAGRVEDSRALLQRLMQLNLNPAMRQEVEAILRHIDDAPQ